ncbi:siderophore-interacting protein [Azorhizobium sp. AG788]|uniref:siderophore-interacting protein n=1 Tax=Azorhizobium sp. AG788 TaxID=2183897 RepID=UPI00313919A2
MTTESQDVKSADPAPRHAGTRVRYTLKARMLTVLRTQRLTPSMLRVVFTGTDMDGFESRGADDHVKLLFPVDGQDIPLLPTFTPNGPVFAEGAVRPEVRDYTPRAYDPESGELTIDFALHEAGPATQWAMHAVPGQRIGMAGPKGSMLPADDFDWYLMIGDETALPAIARRLEALPSGIPALVFVEVAGPADELPLPSRANLTLRWIYRGTAAAGEGQDLEAAVAACALPTGEGYAWVACEGTVAKRLRRILVEQHGHPAVWLKASGYWKRGAQGEHETISS